MSHQKVTYMGMTPEEWYEKHKNNPGWELGPIPEIQLFDMRGLPHERAMEILERECLVDLRERNVFIKELISLRFETNLEEMEYSNQLTNESC